MNMLLKLGGPLVFLLLSVQTSHAQGSNHDGFYMGVEGSYAKTEHNDTTVVAPTFEGVVFEADILSETSRNPVYTAEGAGAGFIIGYRMSSGRFTVATEASYSHGFISNELAANNTFEQTNEFGGSIQPGFWIDQNIVVFGQVGFSQLQTNNVSGTEVFNNSDTGLIFGGGIQLYATDQLSLRGSYTRSTQDHSVTDNVPLYQLENGIPVLIGSVVYEYENTVKRDKFAVSLIYNF